jgi:hypothetical protein
MMSKLSGVASVAWMCLWACGSSRAAESSYQDWQFSDFGANPSVPTVATNAAGVATARIVVGSASAGWLGSLDGFGSETGLWDLGFQNPDGTRGQVLLSIPNPGAAGGSSYTDLRLRVVQFVGGPYTGELTFSIPGAIPGGRTLVEEVPGGLSGMWVEDEFRWRLAPGPEVVSLTITSAALTTVLSRVRVDTESTVSEAVNLVITSVVKSNQVLAISWAGGLPPYEIYVTSNLLSNGPWQQIGLPVSGTNAEIPLVGPVGFVRVRGSN